MWNLQEMHWRLSIITRLFIGLGLFLLAFSARYFLLPLESGHVYVTFYPAILISLYLCGASVGIMVGLTSGLAGAYFFIPPYGQFAQIFFTAGSFFFLLMLIVMSLVVMHMHRYARFMRVMLDNDMIGSLRVRGRRILWHNNAIIRILGYDVEELKGASTRILYPDDVSFERIGREAYPYINDGKSFRTQIQFRRKDGQLIWVDLSGSPLRDHSDDSLWLISDINELKMLEETLKQQAYHDYLTGLPNRRYFIEQASLEISRANRYKRPLSLMMVDIDHFKAVNDTYGHQSGDLVLGALTRVMNATCRRVDLLGRLGGEEFAVLMPATGIEQAADVAERLRAAVEATSVALPQGGLPIKFTVSIGVSSLHAETDNIDLIMHQADDALYKAKNSGRNRVCTDK